MTAEHEETLTRYRVQEAEESLSEGRLLLEGGGSLRSVCNRAYYCMFYAVLALLESKGVGTSKHSGAIAMFNREFVHTGVLGKRFSKALQRAFALRQEQDYRVVADPPQEMVVELLDDAASFVDAVRATLGIS